MTPGVIKFKLLQMETMLSLHLIQKSELLKFKTVLSSMMNYKHCSLKLAPSLYFSESVQASE